MWNVGPLGWRGIPNSHLDQLPIQCFNFLPKVLPKGLPCQGSSPRGFLSILAPDSQDSSEVLLKWRRDLLPGASTTTSSFAPWDFQNTPVQFLIQTHHFTVQNNCHLLKFIFCVPGKLGGHVFPYFLISQLDPEALGHVTCFDLVTDSVLAAPGPKLTDSLTPDPELIETVISLTWQTLFSTYSFKTPALGITEGENWR